MKNQQTNSPKKAGLLWDLFCLCSVVGIWPRYVEPNLLRTTRITLPIANLAKPLRGLKILQISDLHIDTSTSHTFLEKISKNVDLLKPDIIAITGDFISYAQLDAPEKLSQFLKNLKAPHGTFAILGNHDYSSCVSINPSGDYDLINTSTSSLFRAFSRLVESVTLTGKTTKRASCIPPHQGLIDLIQSTNIRLLYNETAVVNIKGAPLNLCGFGEYMIGDCNPQKAYQHYNRNAPGILLLHNPDGARLLKDYPGEIILSGHTHGGQVNLPWMWKKFTLLENMQFKKGMIHLEQRPMYVSRGVGSVIPFRWFSPPELVLMTLEDKEL